MVINSLVVTGSISFRIAARASGKSNGWITYLYVCDIGFRNVRFGVFRMP